MVLKISIGAGGIQRSMDMRVKMRIYDQRVLYLGWIVKIIGREVWQDWLEQVEVLGDI